MLHDIIRTNNVDILHTDKSWKKRIEVPHTKRAELSCRGTDACHIWGRMPSRCWFLRFSTGILLVGSHLPWASSAVACLVEHKAVPSGALQQEVDPPLRDFSIFNQQKLGGEEAQGGSAVSASRSAMQPGTPLRSHLPSRAVFTGQQGHR